MFTCDRSKCLDSDSHKKEEDEEEESGSEQKAGAEFEEKQDKVVVVNTVSPPRLCTEDMYVPILLNIFFLFQN